MAYTDPKPMAPSRVWAIIIVVAIHVLGLWAMFNGGYAYTKKVLTDLEVIEVKEPPPPPEKLPPPPPPDTKLPPPPVVPPPIVTPPPSVTPVYTAPPSPPVFNPPPPPAAPPAPPAPPAVAVPLSPRGSPQSWVTNDDYPPSAQRDGVEGSTGVRVQVGPDGRVTACAVTSSSGSTILDDTACRLVTRRARFNPAKEAGGAAIASSWAGRFRWQIQK